MPTKLIDEEIARLVEIDDKINQKEIELFKQKRSVRMQLCQLRKKRQEIIKNLNRKPGRQPRFTIEQRMKQVKIIKRMRGGGKTWREVSNALGYKNHPECIRILKVFGKEKTNVVRPKLKSRPGVM